MNEHQKFSADASPFSICCCSTPPTFFFDGYLTNPFRNKVFWQPLQLVCSCRKTATTVTTMNTTTATATIITATTTAAATIITATTTAAAAKQKLR